MNRLEEKRLEVLKTIKPICDALGIKEYDYIVKETGQTETLKINNVLIGCSANSINAVVNELVGYIFVSRFVKYRGLGAFQTQVLNHIKAYWIDKGVKE